ncbi:molybdopterin synthase catalytic subunit isoform X6 [Cuculus canorus]|uniref:molybdopterin synthase catalytic subunit isoform X6 n=1 Tax=Cuculus canorus TaxID=55661 RepID=UPI0023AB4E43|nr:molybdopterin synthase catalytic subunit isoform X6 [Cuculus canorus]
MDESEDLPKDFIKLKSEKLSVAEVSELVSSPYCGAVSLFIGTTRNNFEGKKVIHLEYEAYTSMAETEIKKICRDVRQKWPSVKHIAVHHRLGVVPITEASVIIAVSSPHRVESLEAVTYCINTLKASVPIWKKLAYSQITRTRSSGESLQLLLKSRMVVKAPNTFGRIWTSPQ